MEVVLGTSASRKMPTEFRRATDASNGYTSGVLSSYSTRFPLQKYFAIEIQLHYPPKDLAQQFSLFKHLAPYFKITSSVSYF
jgi:hypothetical protein